MKIASLLFAALTLVACGPSYELDSPEELKRAKVVAAPTYALKTTAVEGSTAWQSTFPMTSTYTVFLATEITGTLTGHHVASVYVIAPNGAMYQRLDAPFATTVVAGAGEQQAVKTATGWRVWVSLPVAATTIEQLNLVGTWSSEVWVDAAAAANARTTFVLN